MLLNSSFTRLNTRTLYILIAELNADDEAMILVTFDAFFMIELVQVNSYE